MAEFGNNKRRKIPVSKDDIKKAIKSANLRLKKSNEKLDNNIADKKRVLLDVTKEIKASSNELKSILSKTEDAKSNIVDVRMEVRKERTKLSNLKGGNAKILSENKSVQAGLNKLTKESEVLNKSIIKMQDDLSMASSIKEEIKLIKSDKKIETKELNELNSEANGIKKELSKLRTDSIKKKKEHKKLLNKLDAEAKDKKEVLDNIEGECTIKMAEYNAQIRVLRDGMREKEQEVSIMKSLIDKKELEYIEIESKYRQVERALIYAKELTDNEVDREKKEIEKIKNNFKQWKVAQLEEVAKLKLKKKIENIDKAGLSEILNG